MVDPDLSIQGDELWREVRAGSNFLSQNELLTHFGLGTSANTLAMVRITWPSGAVQELFDVAINQRLSVTEPVPEPHTGWLLLIAAAGCLLSRKQDGHSCSSTNQH
jgi:hypothetical protein